MSEPILSARQLNRTLLARQLLLERSTLPGSAALEHVRGLQTQYAPSGYIGLWSRLHVFRRASLTEALEERRAVQATLMRPTIHMVSADDFRLFAEGSRCVRREWWLRFQRAQLDGIDMDAAADRVRVHLAAGPRQVPEGGTRTRSTQSLHLGRRTRPGSGMARARIPTAMPLRYR